MLLAPCLICLFLPFSCQAHVERSIGLIFKECKRTAAGIHAEVECWEFGGGTSPILFCEPTTVSLH